MWRPGHRADFHLPKRRAKSFRMHIKIHLIFHFHFLHFFIVVITISLPLLCLLISVVFGMVSAEQREDLNEPGMCEGRELPSCSRSRTKNRIEMRACECIMERNHGAA